MTCRLPISTRSRASCSPRSPAPATSPPRAGAHRRARQEGPRRRADGRARHAAAGAAQGASARRSTRSRPASARRSRRARATLERRGAVARGSRPSAPTSRCRCASARSQDGRIHPVSQVFDECVEIFADMGFAVAEGPDIETDDLNFTKLNIPPEHPARQEHDTFYLARRRPDGSRHGAAHAHEPGADPHHAERRSRRSASSRRAASTACDSDADAHADVPSDRGPGDRRDDAHGPPEVVPGGVLQGVLRGRRGEDALPRLALPVHRAVDGSRHRRRGHRQAGPVAGDPRLRHGAPERASATAASIPRSTRASPSAWASTASPC